MVLYVYDAPDMGMVGRHTASWSRALSVSGISAYLPGSPSVENVSASVAPPGIAAPATPSPSIWNWRQYRAMQGWTSQRFGELLVQGGVKYVTPPGFNASVLPAPKVINTTADQFIALANRGIAPVAVPSPKVSPHTLWPVGIYGTATGFPLVQFPPQPKGWLSSAFGYPVVEYKTKVLRPGGTDELALGFPLVRDRAQFVRHQASPITSLFGDVSLRLANRFIRPEGLASLGMSDWAEVRSMRRPVWPAGLDALAFGDTTIANKTPALWPVGFDALAIGTAGVGYYYRTIYPAGVIAPYPQVTAPSLWQTPSLSPPGIAVPAVPAPSIWPGKRNLEAVGRLHEALGEPMVSFSWRRVPLEGSGLDAAAWGTARVEHGRRAVEPLGHELLNFGTAWVSRGQREVTPEGIEYPYMSRHMVGTRRWLGPEGFEATRWLRRIVPENQVLEQQGKRADLHGVPRIENATRSVFPLGITTYPEPFMHWGVNRVWNLRQVITQVEDLQSGLAPPAWPQWTLIENRNKLLGAQGYVATRYGDHLVENGARAVLPAGIAAPELVQWPKPGMVSHAVRPLPLEGIEPPVISRWAVVHNKAVPLKPPGLVATVFGQAEVVNLRRTYRLVGFEAQAFGYPMVAFAVRELTFESRYGIAPPAIPLPVVDLYTRYVEPPGMDGHTTYGSTKVGTPILETRFNRVMPRWTQQHDLFGTETRVRNKTPEYAMRGWDTSEWGDTHVRLQWRPVEPWGTSMELFGRTRIADRRQVIQVPGNNYMVVSDKVTVRRTGMEPVPTQYIDLRKWVDTDDDGVPESEAEKGYGIPDDNGEFFSRQVPKPDLLKGYIFHSSKPELDDMLEMGKPSVTANTIRVEPGYFDFQFGTQFVSLKNRVIEPESIGQLVKDAETPRSMGSWGLLRMSPHTIYAVLEAPPQAKRNHDMENRYIKPVNEGIVLGRPVVSGYVGEIKPSGIGPANSVPPWGIWGVGRPEAYNLRQVVQPHGTNVSRFGWPSIPGTRRIVIDDEEEVIGPEVFGQHTVGRPYVPPPVAPAGIAAPAVEKHEVMHRHRAVAPLSWNSLAMGSSRGDRPYMWQTLHVGPREKPPMQGFETSSYGEPWVSLRVRGVQVEGWDSFTCEYDVENFAKRMRVRRVEDVPTRQTIETQGVAVPGAGLPDARLNLQRISPYAICILRGAISSPEVAHA